MSTWRDRNSEETQPLALMICRRTVSVTRFDRPEAPISISPFTMRNRLTPQKLSPNARLRTLELAVRHHIPQRRQMRIVRPRPAVDHQAAAQVANVQRTLKPASRKAHQHAQRTPRLRLRQLSRRKSVPQTPRQRLALEWPHDSPPAAIAPKNNDNAPLNLNGRIARVHAPIGGVAVAPHASSTVVIASPPEIKLGRELADGLQLQRLHFWPLGDTWDASSCYRPYARAYARGAPPVGPLLHSCFELAGRAQLALGVIGGKALGGLA